jgi:hypothetical protein
VAREESRTKYENLSSEQAATLDSEVFPVMIDDPAGGPPLGGSEGSLDGATVFYANTQTDIDTVVKPMTGGFDVKSVLRSVESPEQLHFRVGLPEGASLAQAKVPKTRNSGHRNALKKENRNAPAVTGAPRPRRQRRRRTRRSRSERKRRDIQSQMPATVSAFDDN